MPPHFSFPLSAEDALKYAWLVVVSFASIFTFWRTQIEPMLDLIERVDFLSVSPPGGEGENQYLDLELEVLMRRQDEYEFRIWAYGKTVPCSACPEDLGKSYIINTRIPIIPPKGIKNIQIGVRGPIGWFTKRKLPLPLVLRIGTQRKVNHSGSRFGL